MVEAESRLERFWREDGLADHDAAFTLAVMQRMARRRLKWGLAALAGVSAVASLVLWGLAPAFMMLFAEMKDWTPMVGPAVVVLVVVASVMVIVAPPMGPGRHRSNDPHVMTKV